MASTRKQEGIDDNTRRLLIRLASRPVTRIVGQPPERPNRWYPFRVPNPEALDLPFNDTSAWHFIADRLRQGEPVETIELDQPEGATGYVMKIELREGSDPLYVKLEVAGNKIIGRSFHLSDRATQ